jgi:hypothetical protein
MFLSSRAVGMHLRQVKRLAAAVHVQSKRLHSTLPNNNNTTSMDRTYHVEVSNVARKNLTQLVITGPGVPGLLASMTVTLAMNGGSIKELVAADAYKEGGIPAVKGQIRDVITVYNYRTGKQFEDADLQSLAEAVLESTKAPINVVSMVQTEIQLAIARREQNESNDTHSGTVTIIPKGNFTQL